MPIFPLSEFKTARISIPVSPAGLPCSAELWLTPDRIQKASSGRVDFTSTGNLQQIELILPMPSNTGNFDVFLDIYAGSSQIGAYQGSEIVTIAAPVPVLEVGYSEQPNSCLMADVYSVLEDKVARGVPDMLYPDITNVKMIYQPVGSKALIFPAWGSWPYIYWQYRGPYQANLTSGIHRFDAATGKLDGVQLAELASVANKAKVRGRITGVASGYTVTADRFSYIIGQAGVIEIDSYEDVPGYASIGAFLAPKMVFAGLSGWPFWNAVYGYPLIPADQEPVMIEVEVSWAYNVTGGQRYIYLQGGNIKLLPKYPPEAYMFSGSLSRGAIDLNQMRDQTIYYNISGNVSPFSVYIFTGVPYPNYYNLAPEGYRKVGPSSGSVLGFSTAAVSMYAHPDPIAPAWTSNWKAMLWKLVASASV